MKVAIVVPCFNEEASLPQWKPLFESSATFWFVDDWSSDNTRWLVARYQDRFDNVHCVLLNRNVGHQRALLKGLLAVKGRCDCAITMDADGQHPPSAIPDFLNKFREGADIVYGVRRRNPSLASRLFYWMMGDSLVANHGDYRLLSAKVLHTLTPDSEPFLRGLFANTNFKTAIVEYDEQPRIAGRSTYTFRKRLALFGSALRWRLTSR
jgi:glycosyltransferase involved in cell wall biosynthesis